LIMLTGEKFAPARSFVLNSLLLYLEGINRNEFNLSQK